MAKKSTPKKKPARAQAPAGTATGIRGTSPTGPETQVSFRIPVADAQALKIHCAKHSISIKAAMQRAIAALLTGQTS